MSIYKNPYLDIEIDFPDDWGMRYWGNRTKEPPNIERFQTQYDDYPVCEKQEKELFFATKRIKGSPFVLSQYIAVAAFYRPNGYQLEQEFEEREVETFREWGFEALGKRNVKFLISHEKGNEYIVRKKFVYWQVLPDIWVNCAVFGDTIENYKSAIKVFLSGKFDQL